MNKIILKTFSTLSLLILCGCELTFGNVNSTVTNSKTSTTSSSMVSTITSTSSKVSSSSSSSSKVDSSTSSSAQPKSLDELLKELSNPNITYHSDLFIYYYELDDGQKQQLQHFDVVAKITEDLYDVVARHVDSNLVEAYQHLEKDGDGYVTTSDINIQNELVVTRAVDGEGDTFLWEDSVYYNLIRELDSEDFTQTKRNRYRYTGNLNETPLNILHTAIPTSYYDMDYFEIVIENNKIDSFIMQEKESDEVYKGCMYGRTLTIKFEDIGTTSIEKIKPYESKQENEPLGNALENIKKENNYTIESIGILDSGDTINFQETYITENDIVQTQHLTNGDYLTGCHTYNNELYIFETIKGYLLGTKANKNTNISSFLPTYNFSKDVFEYLGEEDGYKVYRPFQSMKAVLDYVDVLSYYGDAYYSPAGEINFFVKDNQLAKIEFPVYVYSQADPLIALNRLTYSNIGTTSISNDVWDNFVLQLPKTETSWDAHEFNFYYSNSEYSKLSIGDVLYKCLGDSTLLPYFLSEDVAFNVSGNYSSSDKCVYLMLEPLNDFSTTEREYAKDILTKASFSYRKEDDGFMLIETYRKDKMKIEIISIEDIVEIYIVLPVGNILEK